MAFRFELNLKRMAAIAFASSFWERPYFKSEISQYFRCIGSFHSDDAPVIWDRLTKQVIEELLKINLPYSLTVYIIDILLSFGKKVFCWDLYINKLLDLTYKDLHWTHYGTINQKKMMEEIISRNQDCVCVSVLYAASSCAFLSYLSSAWKWKAVLKAAADYYKSDEKDKYAALFIACTLSYISKDMINPLVVDDTLLKPRNVSKETNLFRLSIFEGCLESTKFYWCKMNAVDQETHLLPAIKKCITLYQKSEKDAKKFFKQEVFIEIFMFLINKMSQQSRIDFMRTNRKEVLNMLMSSWPWHEHFLPTFDELKYWLQAAEQLSILADISSRILKAFQLGYSLETNFYHVLFREVWCLILPLKKQLMAQDLNFKFNVVERLFEACDFTNIKLIINDTSFENDQMEILKHGRKTIRKWLRDDNYCSFRRFVDEILSFFNDQKYSICKDNFLGEFIIYDEIDLIDRLLWWISDNDEERMAIKNNIDSLKICTYLLNVACYSKIDAYLTWQFSTEAERDNYKKRFKSDIAKLVRSVWIDYDEYLTAEKKSLEHLQWFLKSEAEIMQFRQEELVKSGDDDSFVQLVCDYMYSQKNRRYFEKIFLFFHFCFVGFDKIEQIQLKIYNSIDWWITRYGVNRGGCGSYVALECLLDWVCHNNIKKLEIIKMYMNPDNAAKMIRSRFRYSQCQRIEFIRFLRVWFEPLENKQDIIDAINSFSGRELQYSHKSQILSYIQRLQENIPFEEEIQNNRNRVNNNANVNNNNNNNAVLHAVEMYDSSEAEEELNDNPEQDIWGIDEDDEDEL